MIKLEIIANQALERPLIAIMPLREGKPCYTMLKQVDGSGFSGACLGNDVWPEENIMFILYLEEEEAAVVTKKIGELRRRFPLLGLAAFEQPGIREI
jgi:hypothetical protein